MASGNGSLAQNLIDSELNVVALISDQPSAFALTRAKDAGIDTGEIIDTAEVAILASDSEMSLHERIKLVERQLLLKTVKKIIVNLERHV